MARKPGKTCPSDGPRWFKLKSQGLAEETSHLTDAEFRAMILILARQNENGTRGDGGVVYIARTELIGVAPNRRNSTATATRVIRELCASMTWRVHESDAKWTIWTEKAEQNQDFDPATKTKTKTKKTPLTPIEGGESRTLSETLNSEARNGKAPTPRRKLIPKPSQFSPEVRDDLRAWADRKGFSRELLNAGLELFREWEPVKPPYERPEKTWAAAFQKIVRDRITDGSLTTKSGDERKPKGKAYSTWTGHAGADKDGLAQ